MPAPTALIRAPEKLAEEEGATSIGAQNIIEDQALVPDPDNSNASTTIANSQMEFDQDLRPMFQPEKRSKVKSRPETRKVIVPPHRMNTIKSEWPQIYPPLVQHLKLQIRMNPSRKTIEMRTSNLTEDSEALQKGEDFCRAICLGFSTPDAISLLRLDDLFIETFEIKDVKPLSGEHLGRAIGRIAGKDGKTKFAIENATKTRVSLQGQTVHILGGFKNIHMAREAVVSLILGSPPGKVYGNLRTISARMKERF